MYLDKCIFGIDKEQTKYGNIFAVQYVYSTYSSLYTGERLTSINYCVGCNRWTGAAAQRWNRSD